MVVDSTKSYTASVLSGVPQGSVLGPSLFLFYINDLAQDLKSTVRLFADDTIAYIAIKSNEDTRTLQEDLDKLSNWERTWQMEFHPEKCKVIRITRNRTNIIKSNYHLHGHTLQVVDKAKYLGITICHDLRWNEHISNITNKANRSLAFLRRNLRISCPKLKSTAYKALVRPLLEYSSTVWIIDLTYIVPLSHQHNTISRKQQALSIPASNTNIHKNSFYPKTIRDWNLLPSNIISSVSLDIFKSRLVKQ